jgi:lipid-binding SYLF domain-containing protein
MNPSLRLARRTFFSLAFGATILALSPSSALAASASEIDAKVTAALKELYADTPQAKELAQKAVGYLIFPEVIKGGLIVGGQYGEGALRVGGKTQGYYRTTAASIGLQIGGQSFGYIIFFMSDEALKYLDKSEGWDIGTAPTLVYGEEGWSSSLSVQDLEEDILIVFFGQEGIMAGGGIQGTKVIRFNPE